MYEFHSARYRQNLVGYTLKRVKNYYIKLFFSSIYLQNKTHFVIVNKIIRNTINISDCYKKNSNIRKRIHPRFLSTDLHMYLLSYQRKCDGKGTQTFLKLERQYLQDFFTTEHDSIIIPKKVLEHFLNQKTTLPSIFKSNLSSYQENSKKKTFETFLKLFKEQYFQGFRL